MIRVGVLGARGRMGRTASAAITDAADLELVAEVDKGDPLEPLAGCDAVLVFTPPGVVMDNLRWSIAPGLNVVVGISGFGDDRLAQGREWLESSATARVL